MPKEQSSYQKYYREKVVPALRDEFGYKNVMQVPRLKKITLNICLSEALTNAKVLDNAVEEIRAITGQQPVLTRARKSIAAFKLREGQRLGVMVTLRRKAMYEFLNRLCNVALPRVRDFRGLSGRAFDGRGNYSMGITEQIIFPEINYDKIDKIRGMNITIVTTATNNEEGKALLKHMGMPFRN